MKYFSFFFLLLALPVSKVWSQGTQLLRQPTISTENIVFVYANDLWQVSRQSGDAVRLTTDEGEESLPHYSPDENWIAFTGQYHGNTDVFIIPAEGGSPKRLTWHPGGDYVQGWTPEGEVVFRSSREGHPTQTSKLYKVPMNGGLPVSLEIPRAAYGEISSDGEHIAYVPITFWDPEWRNYRGGQAMPIWIVNRTTKELVRTPQPNNERHLDPVWYSDEVFYLSERDYSSNIWSFNPDTKEEKQHTFHAQFDVKSLDACDDGIVYEQGGKLHLLSPETGESKELIVKVQGDMNFARLRWEDVKGSNLSNANLSPTGKRAIFEYRGEIFTVPKEKGSWRNLTNSPGVADRYPVWSPKGDKVAWFSDESGEYQLVVADQFGKNPKSYSLKNPTFFFTPDWSPDGKKIAYTDTDYNIWFIDLEEDEIKKVDTDMFAHPNRTMNPVWSPDSKWIAYVRQLKNSYKAAFAYNVESGEKIQMTDGMADVISPVWDESGKYIYFLASTDYGLNTGWLDMSSYDPDITRSLYCLILAEDEPSPLLPESDDEKTEKEKEEDDDDKNKDEKNGDDEDKAEKKEEGTTVTIDTEGFATRTIALNLPNRNYTGLVPGPENSIFVGENIPHQGGFTLHKFNLKDNKGEPFIEGIRSAVTSADRKNILFQKGSSWSISGTEAKPQNGNSQIETNLKIKVDPQAEYDQIFKEAWRFMRDFLYVDNVHGAPWDKIYEWYSPWIRHVRHRTDLNYVVDILSGEVSIGHSYVSGGDMPDINRVAVGLPGCDFEVEKGFYKIAKIYTPESWNPNLDAPLAQPGLDVNEGDYLLAVNGEELRAPTNPYALFEQTSNRNTRLTINSTPSFEDARDIIVKPASSERQLRSVNWVESNRRKVDELSNGKLAYVYLPNTSGGGFSYFNRYYFAQQDKKGVVLDERNNGGGSAADYMIDVMARTLLGYFNSKAGDNIPWTTPMAGIWGPKVMIINERAGSGGDLLPYMFRAKNIGPLVGTRTWGGLVGTWDTPPFIDGGRMVAPRGGFFDVEGNWAVEGEGVAPDIEVIQHPKLVLEGKDPQLEKAVEVALEMLEKDEFERQPEPPAPVKWKRPEGFEVK